MNFGTHLSHLQSGPLFSWACARDNLECTRQGVQIDSMLINPEPIQELAIVEEGKPLRGVYYQIAHGYRGKQYQRTSTKCLGGEPKKAGNTSYLDRTGPSP